MGQTGWGKFQISWSFGFPRARLTAAELGYGKCWFEIGPWKVLDSEFPRRLAGYCLKASGSQQHGHGAPGFVNSKADERGHPILFCCPAHGHLVFTRAIQMHPACSPFWDGVAPLTPIAETCVGSRNSGHLAQTSANSGCTLDMQFAMGGLARGFYSLS